MQNKRNRIGFKFYDKEEMPEKNQDKISPIQESNEVNDNVDPITQVFLLKISMQINATIQKYFDSDEFVFNQEYVLMDELRKLKATYKTIIK